MPHPGTPFHTCRTISHLSHHFAPWRTLAHHFAPCRTLTHPFAPCGAGLQVQHQYTDQGGAEASCAAAGRGGGSAFPKRVLIMSPHPGQGLGFRAEGQLCLPQVLIMPFTQVRVYGLGFRFRFRFRVQGLGFRV